MAVTLVSPTGIPVKLDDLLVYDPTAGMLTWLPRPKELFHHLRPWAVFRARYENKPALATIQKTGYAAGSIFDVHYYAHRVAWALANGDWPKHNIDHINGIRHDNRLCNLRSVPQSENAKNAALRSDNTSGVQGVYWHKQMGKWGVRIKVEGAYRSFGLYDDIQEAAKVRKEASEKYGYHPNHGQRIARYERDRERRSLRLKA